MKNERNLIHLWLVDIFETASDNRIQYPKKEAQKLCETFAKRIPIFGLETVISVGETFGEYDFDSRDGIHTISFRKFPDLCVEIYPTQSVIESYQVNLANPNDLILDEEY